MNVIVPGGVLLKKGDRVDGVMRHKKDVCPTIKAISLMIRKAIGCAAILKSQ
jgi:hypothetical protein